jgi:hypothetical protein
MSARVATDRTRRILSSGRFDPVAARNFAALLVRAVRSEHARHLTKE